jgi:hypothetical protein
MPSNEEYCVSNILALAYGEQYFSQIVVELYDRSVIESEGY